MSVTMDSHLLSFILVLPLAAALCLALMKGASARWVQFVAAVGSGLPWLAGLWLYLRYRGVGGFEFSDHWPWIESLGITYWVGVDGISLFLIQLTLWLMPVALVMILETGRQAFT